MSPDITRPNVALQLKVLRAFLPSLSISCGFRPFRQEVGEEGSCCLQAECTGLSSTHTCSQVTGLAGGLPSLWGTEVEEGGTDDVPPCLWVT